ncbi:Hypothetical predicted protein [Octopus vulgaris]|uniref:Uncharacterized protein n=1 Tax=Octopus vulgaris TaxID=6645 RepID=A0AA36C0D9_OCTVU|nr:Hypothetical predicted protein [Octopus vulgaris]
MCLITEKIDGDQVNILESVSLLNLDSGLRFPSITSETNKEIFSNELINKLEYRGGDGDGGGRRREIMNNIYEIPRHIEEETSEDYEILGLKDNPKYLLLRRDDNEVFAVLGLDVSDNSLMVFGIIPGRQSFAFFYFDK